MVLQKLLYVLEFAAFITALVTFRKNRNSFWKHFPVYLGFIVLAEQTGNYLNNLEKYALKNLIMDYAVIPVEFLFFYFIYYRNAEKRSGKRLVMVCVFIYLLSFLVDHLYFSGKDFYFMSFSYTVGSLILLVLIIAYFTELVRSSKLIRFGRSLLFWVSLGLLIFYLGTFPYFGLLFLLYDEFRSIYSVYTVIMFACNCMMYSLFTTGLICSKTS